MRNQEAEKTKGKNKRKTKYGSLLGEWKRKEKKEYRK